MADRCARSKSEGETGAVEGEGLRVGEGWGPRIGGRGGGKVVMSAQHSGESARGPWVSLVLCRTAEKRRQRERPLRKGASRPSPGSCSEVGTVVESLPRSLGVFRDSEVEVTAEGALAWRRRGEVV